MIRDFMMQTVPTFSFDNVWQCLSSEGKEELINFWLNEGAIKLRESAEQRLPQVAMIARDPEGNIAAVCTIYTQYCPRLENQVYYFRAFTQPRYRVQKLALQLFCAVRDFLEQAFIAGTQMQGIGMLLELESEILKKYVRDAYHPQSKTTFIGKNDRGDHLRVYYFTGAKIS